MHPRNNCSLPSYYSSSNMIDCFEEYETSCFSGTYVTGASINDEYFAKLHELRNDDAKIKRLETNGTESGMPPGSHDGCENLSNDKRLD